MEVLIVGYPKHRTIIVIIIIILAQTGEQAAQQALLHIRDY